MTEREKAEKVLEDARRNFYSIESKKRLKANKASKDSWLDDIINLIGIKGANDKHQKLLDKENAQLKKKFQEESWNKLMANDHDFFKRLSRRIKDGSWSDKYFEEILHGETLTHKVIEFITLFIEKHSELPTVARIRKELKIQDAQWKAVCKNTDLGGKLPRKQKSKHLL